MNILLFVGEILAFIFFLFWLVFLPGFFILGKKANVLSKIETLVIAISFGIVIFTLTLYLFGLFKMVYVSYILISFVNLYNLRGVKPIFEKKHLYDFVFTLKNNISTILILIATGIFSGSLLFLSGWEKAGEILFTEYRDSFWHLGLMKELVRSIPPLHPGFAPEPLTNYHFFTHLFGAGFLLLSIFNSLDFYFRIFPYFLVFLYVFNLYILGRALTKSRLGGNLAIIFGLLTGSFAYVLPLFLKYPGFNWHESSFWLSQPFSMVINPSFALSSGLFLSSIFLVVKIISSKNSNLVFLLIIISGSLISFKVYAGLLILGGLLIMGLYSLWKSRSLLWLKIFSGSIVISLMLFFPISGKEADKFLVFLPGWYLRSMVESPDRARIIDWVLRENTYLAAGNTFGVIRLRLYEFLIYIVGNLGVRILGLVIAFKELKKLVDLKPINVFLLTILFAGFLIPMFFVQDGSIANALQFSYYGLEIISLYFVLWLTNFLLKKSVRQNIIIIILFLILAIPTSIKTGSEYLFTKQFMIVDKSQIASFKHFLEKETKPDDIILVPATSYYTNSLIVGTLGNRRLYYSDRLMVENTHKNFKERERNINRFFTSRDIGWNTSFLKNNHISYVYLDRNSIPNFNLNFYHLLKVYDYQKIEIYKVI